MRATLTLILRLLVDSDAPQELRGSLQSLTEDGTHPFADEQTLLELLRRVMSQLLDQSHESGEP